VAAKRKKQMTDKATLTAQITNLLPDNNTGDISPADVRTVLNAMVDADLNLAELTQQLALGATYFESAGLTPLAVDPANQEGLVWYDDVNKTLAYYNNLGKQLSGSKKHFVVATADNIAVSSDSNATSFFTGLVELNGIEGFEIHVPSGSVKNVTGKTMAEMTGTISTQPSKSGGNSSVLSLYSERSTDLVTWTKNVNSARIYTIVNAGQSFRTTVSFVSDWVDGEYLRFKFFADDATISFDPASIVADGDTVNSYSAVWNLLEV